MATTGRLKNKQSELETPAETVRCRRCDGLMVIEESFESMTGIAHVNFQARRCVQCGEVTDPIILHNRQSQLGQDFRQTHG